MTTYVNDQKIDPQLIQMEMQRMAQQYMQAFPDKPEQEAREELEQFARENVIEQVLLQQAAMRDGEPPAEENVEAAYEAILKQHGGKTAFYRRFYDSDESKEAEVKKDVARRLQVEAFLNSLAGEMTEPTEEEMQDFYEKNTERFQEPEQVKASHIVKHAKTEDEVEAARPELEQVRKRLRNNANFAEMAQKHSDCPDKGGDLGVFPRGQMVPEFEEVVFNMKAGEISEVFQSPFGLHIAKVDEVIPQRTMPFDQVKEAIQKNLPQIKRQEAIEAFLDKEKEKAVIEERNDGDEEEE